MWRRRESDSVHWQRRVQASSREFISAMAVTLAQRSGVAELPVPGSPASLNGSLPAACASGLTNSRSIPMEKFVIEGGVPLSGTIVPAGNKNGALPILAACLLTDDEVVLRNVPGISDVEAMLLLLEPLGARVENLGPGEVSINTSTVDSFDVDRGLAER